MLFDWDTYFASFMYSLYNRDLAFANAVEVTKGITKRGFIPNSAIFFFGFDEPVSGITHLYDHFILGAAGVYEVTWQVPVVEPGQLALALNGAFLSQTVVGRSTGTTPILGHVLITALAGDSLSIVNPGQSWLTIDANAGGTLPTPPTLVIKRIQ